MTDEQKIIADFFQDVGYVDGKKWVLTRRLLDGTFLYAGMDINSSDFVGVVLDDVAVHIAEYEHSAKDGMKLYAHKTVVKGD